LPERILQNGKTPDAHGEQMNFRWRVVAGVLWLLMSGVGPARAQSPADKATPAAAAKEFTQTAPAFDVKAAVETYLAKMPAEQRARSNAYFEGGYWMQMWDFLSTVAVMWLLLRFGWSARMRDFAERVTRFRPLQTAVYWVQFIVVVSALTFPLGMYEGYFREHKYGLLNQTFGPWLKDQLIGLAVTVILGAVLIVPLFGLVRRLGKNWWVWGAVVTLIFVAFVVLIAPVYLAPCSTNTRYCRTHGLRIRS